MSKPEPWTGEGAIIKVCSLNWVIGQNFYFPKSKNKSSDYFTKKENALMISSFLTNPFIPLTPRKVVFWIESTLFLLPSPPTHSLSLTNPYPAEFNCLGNTKTMSDPNRSALIALNQLVPSLARKWSKEKRQVAPTQAAGLLLLLQGLSH